ncbi:hypothetical protein CcCBS67573_g09730 [Chytriomyces confervae]|uniref:Homeobox domain-containing protein n=1 Tax=Chytriomyces confervae TaxID=246404 RepID=A0A507DR02_9FUNG|nr:hypothetical protein CcCBS67573_g09730 [Chytriomyces confervae]
MDQQAAAAYFPTIDTRRSSLDAGLTVPTFTVPSHASDHIDPLLLTANPITPNTPSFTVAASSRSATMSSPETPATVVPAVMDNSKISADSLMASFMFQGPTKPTQHDFKFPTSALHLSSSDLFLNQTPSGSPEPFDSTATSMIDGYHGRNSSTNSLFSNMGDMSQQAPFEFSNVLFSGASMDMFSRVGSRVGSRATSPTTSFTEMMMSNGSNGTLNQMTPDQYMDTLSTLNAATAVFNRRNSMAFPSTDLFTAPTPRRSPSTSNARRQRCQSDVSGMRRPSVVSSAMSSPYYGHLSAAAAMTCPSTPEMRYFSSESQIASDDMLYSQAYQPAPVVSGKRASLVNMIRRNSMMGSAGHNVNQSNPANNGAAAPPAKKQRFKPNENELNLLMSFFEANPFPDRTQRGQLAIQLGLEPKQILFWFQNRRATLKMNGIHVVKPNAPGDAAGRAGLMPLMAESAFFFVEPSRQEQLVGQI